MMKRIFDYLAGRREKQETPGRMSEDLLVTEMFSLAESMCMRMKALETELEEVRKVLRSTRPAKPKVKAVKPKAKGAKK